ncbi:MAG: ATP-binding protein [Pseudomonadota bacterium]
MWRREAWDLLVPGGCAAAAGIAASQLHGDGIVVAVAAGVGAVVGVLLQGREEVSAALPAAPQPVQDEPNGSIEPEAEFGDLPPGFGRVLLDRLPIGIALITPEGRVQFINPTARALFGPGADSGFPVEALRAPRLLETIEEVVLDEQPREVEFALRRGKSLHLCCHVVSLGAETTLPETGDRPPILVAIEDRTRARRAEELHRDFVANASHELKTPLAAVSGLIETLLGHARSDPDAQARFLPMMAAQAERMGRLVEDLLSLNRIELNERQHPSEPQPIHRIVGEVVEALQPFAEQSGARIVMPAAPRTTGETEGEIEVPGEREELTQVFVNLIENALRYGSDGGSVTLRWRDGGSEHPGMCGITVEDDGPGIAREHLPRLTERFYRVSVSRSRERGGTGLGLAIVKHILNRHRGHLEIDSTPGEGARFTVWLPILSPVGDRTTGNAGIRLSG